jgi:hypothetical protein
MDFLGDTDDDLSFLSEIIDFQFDVDKGSMFLIKGFAILPSWVPASERKPEEARAFFQKRYYEAHCASVESESLPIFNPSSSVKMMIKDTNPTRLPERKNSLISLDSFRVPTKILSIDKPSNQATVLFGRANQEPSVVDLKTLVTQCPVAVCNFYLATADIVK